jgi:hypothetical protein
MNEKEIMSRIEKLEKKNNRMRFINAFLILVIGITGLIAFQSKPEMPRIIEAEKFILKDPELGVLGYFGYSKREDKKSEMIVTDVGLSLNGGVINISRGSQNITIDATKLTFSDRNNQNSKTIELINSADPTLELTSAQRDGKSENINLSPTRIHLFAKSGKQSGMSGTIPRVSFGKGENINNALNLFDAAGRLRTVIGSAIMKDADGKNIVTQESNMILFDSTGKTIYRQPK